MKVIKTRGRRYHTTEDCRGLNRANRMKWIDKETAEMWGLEPCAKCAGSQEYLGESKWSQFVWETRE